MPVNNDKNLNILAKECMEEVGGPGCVEVATKWVTQSTDMGDVSCIMPAIHPYGAGATGNFHGKDFYITDRERACVAPAKCMFLMAERLLSDDAALAKKVIAEKNVRFATREEYLAALDELMADKEAVRYNEDGTIVLDYAN